MANPLKNKHMITAMLIAPVLALIAYFATDYLVAERPHAAQAGEVYPLRASPNCRYQSGHCTLKNADVEMELAAERVASHKVTLRLTSALPVQRALVSFSAPTGGSDSPIAMNAGEGSWQATLDIEDPHQTQMRFVAVIDDVNYYVETEAVFVDYETTFSREHFSNKD